MCWNLAALVGGSKVGSGEVTEVGGNLISI